MKCTKIKHKSYGAARKHANILEQKRLLKYKVYFCNKCNAWHIAHTQEVNMDFKYLVRDGYYWME